MAYQSTGPLLTRPQSPDARVATFADVDTRSTQSIEVTVADECVAFVITGKKGGIKGVVWISPEDALALAGMLTQGKGEQQGHEEWVDWGKDQQQRPKSNKRGTHNQ